MKELAKVWIMAAFLGITFSASIKISGTLSRMATELQLIRMELKEHRP